MDTLALPVLPLSNRRKVSFSDQSGSENGGSSEESRSKPKAAPFQTERIPVRNQRRVSITAGGDAVIVRNAGKSYRSGAPVLNGLNMTVPSGSIYGLLGSSGCGKTTVLSCIAGQRKLDKGKILVFGHKPGTRSIGVPGRNIGYMPQDLSLFMEFSIGEQLEYFGTLCGLSKEEVAEQKELLIGFMELPEETRRISTLRYCTECWISHKFILLPCADLVTPALAVWGGPPTKKKFGGQQRRVSYATAVIHSPELLILDEPTVGLDPLLRQNIWTHLQKLVASKRTTVIITTHCIEECRMANNIGIMRSGRLLAERQLHQLLNEFSTTNLASIVLKLSRRDTHVNHDQREMADAVVVVNAWQNGVKWAEEEHKLARVMIESEPSIVDSFVRIKALAGKNFAILGRNPVLFFLMMFIPATLVFLLCTSLGNDPLNIQMALINGDVSSAQVCDDFSTAGGDCHVQTISCLFLALIPKNRINWRIHSDEISALNAIEAGTVWGYLSIRQNFSDQFHQRISSGSDWEDTISAGAQITVRLDESNKLVSSSIKKVLYDAHNVFMDVLVSDCGFGSRDKSGLKFKEPLFGKDDTDFREFLAPGVTLSLLFFYPIITTSIRLIKERKNGILNRSFVVGVKTWEIMAAYSISDFFIISCQSTLAVIVLRIIFRIHIHGSDLLVMCIVLLSGYAGVAMGLLLGSVCAEEITALSFALAASIPNFILSGVIWPVEGMPVCLQYFVLALPCTLTGEAVRSITSRGLDFLHPNVYPGICVMTGYIFGCFILIVLYHKSVKK